MNNKQMEIQTAFIIKYVKKDFQLCFNQLEEMRSKKQEIFDNLSENFKKRKEGEKLSDQIDLLGIIKEKIINIIDNLNEI